MACKSISVFNSRTVTSQDSTQEVSRLMTKIQKLMLSMFLHLRLGVGIIGLSLPLVLVFGGKLMDVSFAGSMSAYYHATP